MTSLDHAFDLWDWTTVIGLVIVGIVVGYVLLPYAWPLRRVEGMAYPAIMAGVLATTMFAAFFAFLIAFRFAEGMDAAIAAKTIGTGAEGLVFALAVGVGLRLHTPPGETASLDDISAQLADIQQMTAAASVSAERAHIAASAADDRVISQAEHAVDERMRGERLEDALAANTDLTRLAADHADAAYHEANSVNEKIAAQGAVIVAQGEDAIVDRARGVRVEDVGKDTNERTIDIQTRLP